MVADPLDRVENVGQLTPSQKTVGPGFFGHAVFPTIFGTVRSLRRCAPPNALGISPFPASVVNTSAHTEIEFGCGVAKPDPGSDVAGAIDLMSHSDRISAAA